MVKKWLLAACLIAVFVVPVAASETLDSNGSLPGDLFAGIGEFFRSAASWIIPSDGSDPGNVPGVRQVALPMQFVENNGIADESVRYIALAENGGLGFTDGGVVITPDPPEGSTTPVSIALRFAGAADAQPEGADPSDTRVSIFSGSDPSAWKTGLAAYRSIVYSDLYPGINLRYGGDSGVLKSEFYLMPGADPSLIVMDYSGVDRITLAENGDLLLEAGGVELRELAPVAGQVRDGVPVRVEAGYVMLGENRVGFSLGPYDRESGLVIDPVLKYGIYLIGTGVADGRAVAVDGEGNTYVAGRTTATSRQGGAAQTDAIVVKIDAAGDEAEYITILSGSADDVAQSVAVDGDGTAYLCGTTSSNDFPVNNAIQPFLSGGSDAFAVKLDADGSTILYSTYLGGTRDDEGAGIAIDENGSAYVTGTTASEKFPVVSVFNKTFLSGPDDAFALKLSADGSELVYSTFIGGISSETGSGIAVDDEGNAYLTGETFSPDFPSMNSTRMFEGYSDAFITKINVSGDIFGFSTVIGGESRDYASAIALGADGSSYITGSTHSAAFPVVNPVKASHSGPIDAFATRIAPDGRSLIFSTYLGGSAVDQGTGIGVSGDGTAFVGGSTYSLDFPLANPYQSKWGGGTYDGFVVKLRPAGNSYVYSTYIGGNGRDLVNGLAIDDEGTAYITGSTTSTNFPIVYPYPDAFDERGEGGFLAALSEEVPVTTTPTTTVTTIIPTTNVTTVTPTTSVTTVVPTTNVTTVTPTTSVTTVVPTTNVTTVTPTTSVTTVVPTTNVTTVTPTTSVTTVVPTTTITTAPPTTTTTIVNPQIPHLFYGNVTVMGNPAPAGSVISATVTGGSGSLVTTTGGKYGGPLGLEPKLMVQAAGAPIEAGAPISFFVNGAPAECREAVNGSTWTDSFPFSSGTVTDLDLRTNATPGANHTIVASAGAGGTISPSGSVTVFNGATQNFVITPNSGFAISTLVVDGIQVKTATGYTFTNVTADHTIAVTFTSGTFTITATAGPNGVISPSGGVLVTPGGSQEFVMTPGTGFRLGNTLVDGVSLGPVSPYQFVNVTSNHTIEAAFIPENATMHQISATAGLFGRIFPPGLVQVPDGANQSFAIAADNRAAILDVKVDNVSVGAVDNYTFVNVVADHSISATFEPPMFTINAAPVGNGNITPFGDIPVRGGENASFSITPASGYRVSQVLVDSVSVGPVSSYTFVSVTANHTIRATFTVDAYTITATAGANGQIKPSGAISVSPGGSQVFTMSPAGGFYVQNVMVDGNSLGAKSSYTFDNVNQDHTISVIFSGTGGGGSGGGGGGGGGGGYTVSDTTATTTVTTTVTTSGSGTNETGNATVTTKPTTVATTLPTIATTVTTPQYTTPTITPAVTAIAPFWSSGPYTILIPVIILIIILAGIGYYYYRRQKQEKEILEGRI